MAVAYVSMNNTFDSLSWGNISNASPTHDYRIWAIDEETVSDNGAVCIKVSYGSGPSHVLVYKDYDVFYEIRNSGTINPDDERVTKKFKFMELETAKEYAASL